MHPDDFDAYWNGVIQELKQVPPAAEVKEIPLRSTEYCTAYTVRFSGIGPYRLFGYLSIPRGEGPFPALVYLGGYRSVVEVIPQGDANEKRERYLIFSAASRGQRNADRPYEARVPGLLTEGVEDPATYIMRAWVADCCRAVEYLLSRPEVDRERVAAVGGNELPLLTAALYSGLTHVVAEPVLFYRALERASGTCAYPLEEFNDYLRIYPNRRAAVAKTLSYFEPLSFAPMVEATTLLWGHSESAGPLAAALKGEVELHSSEASRYRDGVYQEKWLARQLGLGKPVLPAHWQV